MALGDRIGRYEIVRTLAAGGMARIDLARRLGDAGFQRYVVLKRPLAHQTDDTAARQFRLEAELLARFHHPNIIGFVDAGSEPDGDFLVLEYVHGITLRELAPPEDDRVRRPSLVTALAIIRAVAAGLAHAHAQRDSNGAPLGIVHRDVSPSNVLVGYDGSVKLIDFGVAKLTTATASNGLRGKVMYMAPEQCKALPLDHRADVYAAGVMLYELVTGVRPFYAREDVAVLHRVVTERAVDPRRVIDVDDNLADVITSAIDPDPSARTATASELVAAIDAYASAHQLELGATAVADAMAALGSRPEPWHGSPPTTRKPARTVARWRWLAGTALLGAGIAGSFAWYEMREQARHQPKLVPRAATPAPIDREPPPPPTVAPTPTIEASRNTERVTKRVTKPRPKPPTAAPVPAPVPVAPPVQNDPPIVQPDPPAPAPKRKTPEWNEDDFGLDRSKRE